ncbi:MAG: J domain-containing protein [Hylemonella sp.]
MIRFTHGWDLLYRIGLFFAGLYLLTAVNTMVEPMTTPIEQFLKYRTSNGWFWDVLVIGYFIFGVISCVLLLKRTLLPPWIPTLLYVRLHIDTKISPQEAQKVAFLFDGSLDGTWYPLGQLSKIHPDYRNETLFRFANKIASEQGWRKIFEMPEDRSWRQREQSQHEGANGGTGPSSTPPQPTPRDIALIAASQLGLTELPPDIETVKKAYRRKVQEFHPDKFAGAKPELLQHAEETTKRLNAAFAYLDKYYGSQ